MWSLSYTGQRSRFMEAQRVGVALDVGDISRQPETDPEEEVIMTDGALIEVINRSVARGMRTLFCHQRASHVCKSVFLKMFSKRSGTKDSGASLNREDFIISLVMPMEIFRANKSDTGGALKQAVADLGLEYVDTILLPWPTESKDFVGPQSTQEAQVFRSGWRKACDLMKQNPRLIRELGVIDMEVWHFEAALEPVGSGSYRKPAVHYFSDLTPCNPRLREVCLSHQHGVEVAASVDQPHDTTQPPFQDIVNDCAKTPVEVLSTWCYQRGIVAMPRLQPLRGQKRSLKGPDEYAKWKEALEAGLKLLETLVYPLTRRPVFYAPTQRWAFFLTHEQLEALNGMGQGAMTGGPEASNPSPQLGGSSKEGSAAEVLVEQHKGILKQVEKDLERLNLPGPPGVLSIVSREMPAYEDQTLDKEALWPNNAEPLLGTEQEQDNSTPRAVE